MNQKSIKRPIKLSGLTLHGGKDSTLIFHPGEKYGGVYFVYNGKKIEATVKNVKKTERGTTLGEITLVEHVLASAYGLGIDNLKIELSEREPPNIDGSALPFVLALKEAQIIEQNALKEFFTAPKALKVEEGGASLEILPFDGFKVDFMIDFPAIGQQHLVFEGDFEKEIAPARTFGYIEELDELQKRGLAHGATLEYALGISQKGYINKPRFKDEPVRHKILDLIGDLALLGRPLKGHFIARKSGHRLNIMLARLLAKEL